MQRGSPHPSLSQSVIDIRSKRHVRAAAVVLATVVALSVGPAPLEIGAAVAAPSAGGPDTGSPGGSDNGTPGTAASQVRIPAVRGAFKLQQRVNEFWAVEQRLADASARLLMAQQALQAAEQPAEGRPPTPAGRLRALRRTVDALTATVEGLQNRVIKLAGEIATKAARSGVTDSVRSVTSVAQAVTDARSQQGARLMAAAETLAELKIPVAVRIKRVLKPGWKLAELAEDGQINASLIDTYTAKPRRSGNQTQASDTSPPARTSLPQSLAAAAGKHISAPFVALSQRIDATIGVRLEYLPATKTWFLVLTRAQDKLGYEEVPNAVRLSPKLEGIPGVGDTVERLNGPRGYIPLGHLGPVVPVAIFEVNGNLQIAVGTKWEQKLNRENWVGINLLSLKPQARVVTGSSSNPESPKVSRQNRATFKIDFAVSPGIVVPGVHTPLKLPTEVKISVEPDLKWPQGTDANGAWSFQAKTTLEAISAIKLSPSAWVDRINAILDLLNLPHVAAPGLLKAVSISTEGAAVVDLPLQKVPGWLPLVRKLVRPLGITVDEEGVFTVPKRLLPSTASAQQTGSSSDSADLLTPPQFPTSPGGGLPQTILTPAQARDLGIKNALGSGQMNQLRHLLKNEATRAAQDLKTLKDIRSSWPSTQLHDPAIGQIDQAIKAAEHDAAQALRELAELNSGDMTRQWQYVKKNSRPTSQRTPTSSPDTPANREAPAVTTADRNPAAREQAAGSGSSGGMPVSAGGSDVGVEGGQSGGSGSSAPLDSAVPVQAPPVSPATSAGGGPVTAPPVRISELQPDGEPAVQGDEGIGTPLPGSPVRVARPGELNRIPVPALVPDIPGPVPDPVPQVPGEVAQVPGLAPPGPGPVSQSVGSLQGPGPGQQRGRQSAGGGAPGGSVGLPLPAAVQPQSAYGQADVPGAAGGLVQQPHDAGGVVAGPARTVGQQPVEEAGTAAGQVPLPRPGQAPVTGGESPSVPGEGTAPDTADAPGTGSEQGSPAGSPDGPMVPADWREKLKQWGQLAGAGESEPAPVDEPVPAGGSLVGAEAGSTPDSHVLGYSAGPSDPDTCRAMAGGRCVNDGLNDGIGNDVCSGRMEGGRCIEEPADPLGKDNDPNGVMDRTGSIGNDVCFGRMEAGRCIEEPADPLGKDNDPNGVMDRTGSIGNDVCFGRMEGGRCIEDNPLPPPSIPAAPAPQTDQKASTATPATPYTPQQEPAQPAPGTATNETTQAGQPTPPDTTNQPDPSNTGGQITPPSTDGQITPPGTDGQITPPSTDGQVTPPGTDGQVTPPGTDGQVTPPGTDGQVTPPGTDGQVTPPSTDGQVTPPSTGGEVTPPNTGGQVTPPSTDGQVTPPSTDGQVTPPSTDGQVTPPSTDGQVTPPSTDGQVTPPATDGQVTPLATDGQVTPPATDGQVAPPSTGGQVTPSRVGNEEPSGESGVPAVEGGFPILTGGAPSTGGPGGPGLPNGSDGQKPNATNLKSQLGDGNTPSNSGPDSTGPGNGSGTPLLAADLPPSAGGSGDTGNQPGTSADNGQGTSSDQSNGQNTPPPANGGNNTQGASNDGGGGQNGPQNPGSQPPTDNSGTANNLSPSQMNGIDHSLAVNNPPPANNGGGDNSQPPSGNGGGGDGQGGGSSPQPQPQPEPAPAPQSPPPANSGGNDQGGGGSQPATDSGSNQSNSQPSGNPNGTQQGGHA